MKKKYKVEVEGEIVYLRKSFIGWLVIHPVRINNKFNWKNFITGGHWLKPVIIILIVLIILGCISEYNTAVSLLNECLSNKVIWKN